MGACSVWDIDLECCDLPDDVAQETIDTWQAVATDILWYASGQRYGVCEVTIRPCLRRCGGGSGPWVPYKDASGEWRNFWACGCRDDCSCVALCEVVLPGPVASVVQVLIDGDELEEQNYRLDTVGGQWRLVRTDGGCWPECSDMSVGCDEEGAFCVTYEQGIAVDALGTQAVTQLTCELVKSCLPNCACLLPKNVASLTRRGVAITFDTAKPWLRSLPMVAAWLDAVNPHGLTSASTVWSPDISHPRITPEPSVS